MSRGWERELGGCRGKPGGHGPGGAEEMERGDDLLEKGEWTVLRLDMGLGVRGDSQVLALQHWVDSGVVGAGRGRERESTHEREQAFELSELEMLLSNL